MYWMLRSRSVRLLYQIISQKKLFLVRQQNGLLCNALPFIHMYVAVHNTFIFNRTTTRKEEKQNIPRPMYNNNEYNDADNRDAICNTRACMPYLCMGATHSWQIHHTTMKRVKKIAIFLPMPYSKYFAVRQTATEAIITTTTAAKHFHFINKRASLPLFRYRLCALARSQNTPKQIQSPHIHTSNPANKYKQQVNRISKSSLPFHHQNVAKACVYKTDDDGGDDGDNHDAELYRLLTFLLQVFFLLSHDPERNRCSRHMKNTSRI